VHTLPYESKYKVYIVDEVHMLTKEAFNALLKTLEEPPAHVIFILATTEEEKLLDTILSRCQVFRFRSPSRAVLAQIVTEVAAKEGFKLSPDAADLIAIAADGSFRDALGVTQKVILASGDTIGNANEVAAIIGAPRGEILLSLITALHEGSTDKALEALHLAVEAHVDMKLFARLLLENLRAVMLVRHQPAKVDELLSNFGPAAKETLLTIAKVAKSPTNSQMLLRLLAATEQITYSPIPHLPLEIAVIELTTK
jgi:DNA polymerase-3 subunit gamma/tau